MTPAALIGYVLVPLFGAVLCGAPLATRPTIRFGVRVPPAQLTAPVIRRARRGYRWRSAVVAICCPAAQIAFGGSAPWWHSRLILIAEIAVDLGCFCLAHQQIVKVKSAEGWFAGRRQTVVADTGWRTEPLRFPIGWLLPAVVLIVVTVTIGLLRYPDLPGYLDSGGRPAATSPVTAFAVVAGQVYVTGLGTGLLALGYRSRPDLDTADPGGEPARLPQGPRRVRAGRAGPVRLHRSHPAAGRAATVPGSSWWPACSARCVTSTSACTTGSTPNIRASTS